METPARVTLHPPDSPLANAVSAAARAAGLIFIAAPDCAAGDIQVIHLDDPTAPSTADENTILIAAGEWADGSAWASCFDILAPEELPRRLHRTLRNLARVQDLHRQVAVEQGTVRILNEIGYAFSAITEQDKLLHRILSKAREVIKADSGTLYLVKAGGLHFEAAQNDTVTFDPRAHVLPLDENSLAGCAAVRCSVLRIDDVYNLAPDEPYTFNRDFDLRHGYRTRSMLLVPMRNRDGKVIGVLSLINRKARPGMPLASAEEVLPFTDGDVALARSIAGQAAAAVENYQLYNEIRTLFEGFVLASVKTIEARDPTTGGHSKRVADLTLALANAVDETKEGPYRDVRFSPEDLRELRYAAILHDFGKVDVREHILLKAEKLYPWELHRLEARFRHAALQQVHNTCMSRDLERLQRDLAQLQDDLAFIRKLNRPGRPLDSQQRERLSAVAARWRLEDMDEQVISKTNLERLSIAYGSLDESERREVNEHVVHTFRFLQLIPWTAGFHRVPHLAAAHHECLDGSGYPAGLVGDAIPFASRLMAICDVFDAVTAGDRPYRSAMTVEQAIGLLRQQAAAGKLESAAVELFVERRLWQDIIQPDA